MSQFLIRSVRESDLDDLLRLSRLVYFINLPNDREILKRKIDKSMNSFNGNIEDKFKREYIFVIEDTKEQKIIGTSMIIARHGSPEEPHMYLELNEVQKYSETIHTGFIHKVLRLKFDSDGPTEIGGLVMDPAYRGHAGKLGRQLSFARFLFIKMRRRWFKDRILSELMPPLTESGESILWENLGRKFTNLSYQDADLLSRKNKEFITSLFPKGDIYTVLLPGEARDAIGRVGKATEPVKYMLEKIGFRWKGHIDPFDGGPHYWADTDKLSIIQQSKKVSLNKEALKGRSKSKALIGCITNDEFICIQSPYEFFRGTVLLPRSTIETLGLKTPAQVFAMPLDLSAEDSAKTTSRARLMPSFSQLEPSLHRMHAQETSLL
ncbi:MAG: arginine N-succinyltransferase [Proteobacteria bacterium]|nr:arginine N-succinyltransferase [Pseudomonadota bacterium]NBY19868.1 arginine N-succinyltransferase [bacterium]